MTNTFLLMELLGSLTGSQARRVWPLPPSDYDTNQQQNLNILSANQRLNPSQPIKIHAFRIGSIRNSPFLTFIQFSNCLLLNAKRITPPRMNKSIIIQVDQDNFFFSIIKFIPGCFLQECP
jgi:hypothetical protein